MSGDGADLRDAWGRFYRQTSESAIRDLLEAYPKERSLYVDVLQLYEFDESFTRGLFTHPDRYLDAGADALRGLDDSFDRVNVRLMNHPGLLALKNLRSRHVSELVTVEGVVTDVDPVQATATSAVFGCQRCGHAVKRRARRRVETPGDCPECGAIGSFRFDADRSTLVDVQRFRLETPPDERRDDEPATGIEVLVDDDLVGTVGVDERLLATGVVRVEHRADAGRFDFLLDTNALDAEPAGAPAGIDDVSAELRRAINARWELLSGP